METVLFIPLSSELPHMDEAVTALSPRATDGGVFENETRRQMCSEEQKQKRGRRGGQGGPKKHGFPHKRQSLPAK